MTKEQRKWEAMRHSQTMFDFGQEDHDDERCANEKRNTQDGKPKYKIHRGLNRLPIGDFLYLTNDDRESLRYVNYTYEELDDMVGDVDSIVEDISNVWNWQYEFTIGENNGFLEMLFFSTRKRFTFGKANRIRVHRIFTKLVSRPGRTDNNDPAAFRPAESKRIPYSEEYDDEDYLRAGYSSEFLPSERGDWEATGHPYD